jgi:hypothetical protein
LVSVNTEALSEGNQLVALALKCRDEPGNELVSGGLNRLMVQGQEVLRLLVKGVGINRFALCDGRSEGIFAIQVPDGKGLAADVGGLTDEIIVVAIRRTHESRVSAGNLHESLFDAPHLIVDLVPGERGKILVGPSVGGKLMSFVVQVLDALAIVVVDALVVVTIDEESALCASSNESFADVVHVDVGTIIESQSNSIVLGAARVDSGQGSCALLDWVRRGGRDEASGGSGEDCGERELHCEKRKGKEWSGLRECG